MQKCPNCQYRTNNPKQMERHQKNTGHGNTASGKVWKGHKKISGKK